jgi:hypothetical protein
MQPTRTDAMNTSRTLRLIAATVSVVVTFGLLQSVFLIAADANATQVAQVKQATVITIAAAR